MPNGIEKAATVASVRCVQVHVLALPTGKFQAMARKPGELRRERAAGFAHFAQCVRSGQANGWIAVMKQLTIDTLNFTVETHRIVKEEAL